MDRRNGKFQRVWAIVLAAALAVGVFQTTAFAAVSAARPAAVKTAVTAAADLAGATDVSADQETLTATKVDLSNVNLSSAAQALLDKKGVDASTALTKATVFANDGSDQTQTNSYVESVASDLSSPVGMEGFENSAANQTVQAYIWLTSLPSALKTVYTAQRMDVTGYSAAEQAATVARTQIQNHFGSAANLEIVWDYDAAFSGFAVNATVAELQDIATWDGVYAVTPVGTSSVDYTADPDYTTPGNAGTREALGLGPVVTGGIDGTGVNVLVIDTGIDAHHPDLQGAFRSGYVYTTDSKLATQHTTDMSMPDANHGTHVSGIIASQGVNSLGVAPGVNLYVAQVFDPYNTNSASNSDIMAAINDAAAGGAHGIPKPDVVNMSLGSNADTAYDAESYAINNAIISGISFAISAGNNAYPSDGSAPTQRNNYTLGTPGTTSLAVTVAASQYGGNPLTTYNTQVTFNGTPTTTIPMSVENSDRSLPQPFGNSQNFQDGQIGANAPGAQGYRLYYADPETADMSSETSMTSLPTNSLAGQILVVNRGQNFVDYLAQAQRLGCIGLIVLNRTESFIGNMAIGDTSSSDTMVFSSPVSARQNLMNVVATSDDGHTAYLQPGGIVKVAYPAEPADFSSIGPVGETGEIKPDVIAPGYAILSTSLSQDANYNIISDDYVEMGGTSMSSPCVAACLALLKEKYPTATPAELKARLMSTANPNLIQPNSANDTTNGTYYFNAAGTQTSVMEQGAGFVNPARAINEDVYVTTDEIVPTGNTDESTEEATMSSFSFGMTSQGTTSDPITATVHAPGVSTSADYDVSVIYNNNTRYSQDCTGNVTANVTKNGDNTFNVTLTIADNAIDDPSLGNIYEGYIVVTVAGKTYSLPWATRVGAFIPPSDFLAAMDRPVMAATTSTAGPDMSTYSAQNTIYFGFTGNGLADEIPLTVTTSGSRYSITLPILFFNHDNPNVPAYRVNVGLVSNATGTAPKNPKLSDYLTCDGGVYQISAWTAAGQAYNATTKTWGTSNAAFTANKGYYVGFEFIDPDMGDYYNYYLELGMVVTNQRPVLTINNSASTATATTLAADPVTVANTNTVTAATSTYGLSAIGDTSYTVTGNITSPAVQMAADCGFAWGGYYLLAYNEIITLDQSVNALEAQTSSSTTGNGVDFQFYMDDYGAAVPWICDQDGNFSLTFPVTGSAANAYLLNYTYNSTTGFTWNPTSGTLQHNARAVDAFDASYISAGSNYYLLGSLVTNAWTPYVRVAEPVVASATLTQDDAGGTIVATLAMNDGSDVFPATLNWAKYAVTMYKNGVLDKTLDATTGVYDPIAGTITWTYTPAYGHVLDQDTTIYGQIVQTLSTNVNVTVKTNEITVDADKCTGVDFVPPTTLAYDVNTATELDLTGMSVTFNYLYVESTVYLDGDGEGTAYTVDSSEVDFATLGTYTVSVYDMSGNLIGTFDVKIQQAFNAAYDINGDGKIDSADLAIIMANLNKKASTNATTKKCDLDGDGVVTLNDYAILAAYIAAM